MDFACSMSIHCRFCAAFRRYILFKQCFVEIQIQEKVGSIVSCHSLHRSNLMTFVGASNSKYPSNTVFVWDDKLKTPVLEVCVLT